MSSTSTGPMTQPFAPYVLPSRLCAKQQRLTQRRKVKTKGAKKSLTLVVLLLLMPCAARGQQAAAADKGRAGSSRGGAITGRVVGEDGRPLAEAVVQVIKAYARVPGPPLATSTDGDGKFRMPDLEPGLYAVAATMPGYVSSQEAQQGAGDEARYYRPGDNVNVTLAKGGVITGTVRDERGEPIVAISVRAVRVRDEAGRATNTSRFNHGFIPERLTDDRGIYRLFGLPPGTYIVVAGGGQRLYGAFNAYLGDAPTYFPSSTRDAAGEVNVRGGGEEVSGVDIRFRNERAYTVSGTLSGALADKERYGISVVMRRLGGAETEWASYPGHEPRQAFSFGGVADGEYEVTAQQWGGSDRSGLSSIPRRVTVRGADVTGLALTLAPLASIEGRVQLEPAPAEPCAKPTRAATVLETAVNARPDEKAAAKEPSSHPFAMLGATPNERGEFTIRNLLEGSYRLTVRLPAEQWYTRSLVLPGAAPKPPAPTNAVALKMGQTLAGVAVQVAQDGATLSGRVRPAAEGLALPANLKLHLVPTERERAEDFLRYAEVSVSDGGAFSLTNLAPGRYKLLLRPVPEDESAAARPLAWDAQGRAKLRRDAEAATTLELKPCQRAADHELRYK